MFSNTPLLSRIGITCKSAIRKSALYNNYLKKKIIGFFIANGIIPWTPGYSEYKWDMTRSVPLDNNFWEKIGSYRFGYRIEMVK